MDTSHTPPQVGASEKKSNVTEATRQGIAIVSFVAIAIIGMAIAVYAARFVPGAIGGVGSASAYLSSLFVPAPSAPKNETPKPVATTTPATATTTVITTIITPVATTTPAAKPKPAVTYSGYSDIQATMLSMGYCTTRYQNSFVPSSVIPAGAAFGGATFEFTNVGTNIAPANWQFRVDTSSGSNTSYGVTLRPGQSAAGVVCFDRVGGTNTVSVTADSASQVTEMSESNNRASGSISANDSYNSNNSNNYIYRTTGNVSCDFSADDTSISDGDSVRLRWNTDNANRVSVNHGIGNVSLNSSYTVSPSVTTTYTLTAQDNDGNEDTCNVTVRVSNSNNNSSNNGNLSCDIYADNSSVQNGSSTLLHWTTRGNVDSASINQGIGSVNQDSGSKRVYPNSQTNYRMTVSDDNGNQSTCQTSVGVYTN